MADTEAIRRGMGREDAMPEQTPPAEGAPGAPAQVDPRVKTVLQATVLLIKKIFADKQGTAEDIAQLEELFPKVIELANEQIPGAVEKPEQPAEEVPAEEGAIPESPASVNPNARPMGNMQR